MGLPLSIPSVLPHAHGVPGFGVYGCRMLLPSPFPWEIGVAGRLFQRGEASRCSRRTPRCPGHVVQIDEGNEVLRRTTLLT